MYRGLIVSGAILGIFGLFLIFTDLYVPLGTSIFGLPFLLVGAVMFAMGFFRAEPLPIEPALGKKFCWYCMVQIPKASRECPNCSLTQYNFD